jgi:dihydroorotase-like cyclic amidohydrolase
MLAGTMSILIRGGAVINHDHSRRADVLIEGETIAAVALRSSRRPAPGSSTRRLRHDAWRH